jgi:hypothetical protein
VSVAPPVPRHLDALDLPSSGIDDNPLTPAAVSRERGALPVHVLLCRLEELDLICLDYALT